MVPDLYVFRADFRVVQYRNFADKQLHTCIHLPYNFNVRCKLYDIMSLKCTETKNKASNTKHGLR